jgi:pimeloyl-ACP methyl ester carboxylesterase
MFALRHPKSVRALLLFRVTGGPFAAQNLPENYYGQFIKAAQQGGMAAVCATEGYAERIRDNPANKEKLLAMDPKKFIDVMQRLKDLFVAGANLPVMGVTEAELKSIKAPTIVIPGNDKTHSSVSGRVAHQMIPGSEIHELTGIKDIDLPLVPFDQWGQYEPEITRVFADFMRRVEAKQKQPA